MLSLAKVDWWSHSSSVNGRKNFVCRISQTHRARGVHEKHGHCHETSHETATSSSSLQLFKAKPILGFKFLLFFKQYVFESQMPQPCEHPRHNTTSSVYISNRLHIHFVSWCILHIVCCCQNNMNLYPMFTHNTRTHTQITLWPPALYCVNPPFAAKTALTCRGMDSNGLVGYSAAMQPHAQQTAMHCVLWHLFIKTSINLWSNLSNLTHCHWNPFMHMQSHCLLLVLQTIWNVMDHEAFLTFTMLFFFQSFSYMFILISSV